MKTLEAAWYETLQDDEQHRMTSLASLLSDATIAAILSDLHGWNGPDVAMLRAGCQTIQAKRKKVKQQ